MANEAFYSNTAAETTLSGSINASQTSIIVGDVTGWPVNFPYDISVDYESAGEELCRVTAAAGTTLTVVRGHSGTSAASHSLGARVVPVWHAGDATDFRTHEATAIGVHGLAGAVVGTSDTQTLSGKTLTSPTINSGAISGTFTGSATFSGAISLTGGGTFTGTFTGSPTFSGAVTLSGGGTLGGAFAGAAFFSGGHVFTGNPAFQAAASSSALRAQVSGDTTAHLSIRGDGRLMWSDGTSASDVNLYRESADVLTTDSLMRSNRPTATDNAFSTKITADTLSRFLVRADGRLQWGPGGAATQDTVLYRDSADVLKTDDAFVALVETTSSGLTAQTGYSTPTITARKTCGVVSMYCTVTRTGGTINPDSGGNITDSPCATLPAGWRPPHNIVTAYSVAGAAVGDILIETSGVVTLKTLSTGGNLTNGQEIRFSPMWVA